jgi:hypothetical protein
MRVLWQALVVAVVPILLTQTALAQEVKADFDRSVDFTTFRRYAWKVHPLLEQDPELLNSIGGTRPDGSKRKADRSWF